jgi:hypothetical protein
MKRLFLLNWIIQRLFPARAASTTHRLSSIAMLIPLLLALGFESAPIPPTMAAPQATFTVSNTVDELDAGSCSLINAASGAGADGKLSLREAVCEANNTGAGPHTITLPAGTYSLTNLDTGELRIGPAGDITVNLSGAGAASTIIQQTDGVDRVFNLDPNLKGNVNITISGVTISGGHSESDHLGGAGIIGGCETPGCPSGPDSTTIQNSVITNNHANSTTPNNTTSPGGGVQIIGGNLTIANVTFTNNTSGSSQGGGVYYNTHSPSTGSLNITSSIFDGNGMTSNQPGFAGGGALAIVALPGSTIHIKFTTFINNSVNNGNPAGLAGGGAIFAQGVLNVDSSTFSGNQANGAVGQLAGGGAIQIGNGNATITFSHILGNSASNGPSGLLNNSVAGSTAAIDNWWGCNGGPGTVGCDTVANTGAGSGTLTYFPWLMRPLFLVLVMKNP